MVISNIPTADWFKDDSWIDPDHFTRGTAVSWWNHVRVAEMKEKLKHCGVIFAGNASKIMLFELLFDYFEMDPRNPNNIIVPIAPPPAPVAVSNLPPVDWFSNPGWIDPDCFNEFFTKFLVSSYKSSSNKGEIVTFRGYICFKCYQSGCFAIIEGFYDEQ
jgi:hypothetical protein